MTAQHLLIRADASAEIGTGHVMRCLALAQAWQDVGGAVTFCCASLPTALVSRLVAENMIVRMLDVAAASMADADAVIRLAGEIVASAVVVDGYVFGAEYQKAIKDAGLRLLFIDDNGHAEHYCADFVLNQNAHAESALYLRRDANTRLLLGPSYVLLRREFRKWHEWQRTIAPNCRNLLVTMGGSDPNNFTPRLVTYLRNMALDTVVIVGGSNQNLDEIREAARGASIEIRDNVTDMPDLMAWADLAITAAGSTCWELAFMGVPMIIVVTAENQLGAARTMASLGIALYAGWYTQLNQHDIIDMIEQIERRRDEMSKLQRQLIDGFGSLRVCREIL